MSIPLDNLYEYLESLINEPIHCYLFYPHGSRNISNFQRLHCKHLDNLGPTVLFHDQEPIDLSLYSDKSVTFSEPEKKTKYQHYFSDPLTNRDIFSNLIVSSGNIPFWDKNILVHSEKNSDAVLQLRNFVPVHFWSHAAIALDWYRFARHDLSLKIKNKNRKKFLIYSRGWQGTREYRIKFAELLVSNKLVNESIFSILRSENNTALDQHIFKNNKFKVNDFSEILQLTANTCSGNASAQYESIDFTNSDISIVLETLFDDQRIQLTEKILRPIACGHPFILAAAARGLEYIKSYGFKTFSPWIDETYDQELDPLSRLNKIIVEMQRLANLSPADYAKTLVELNKIAKFNKNHFFSKKFELSIYAEFIENMKSAINIIKTNTTGRKYLAYLKSIKKIPDYQSLTLHRPIRLLTLRKIRQQNGIYRKPKPTTDQ